MWAALGKLALQFVPKDKLLLYVLVSPLAFALFLLLMIGGPSAVYKHVPLAEDHQYQYYVQATQQIQAETGVLVNWQEIMAIDAVVLEQDFSKSSLDRALGYKRFFIREETVQVTCPQPSSTTDDSEDDEAEDQGEGEGEDEEEICYQTVYYPRSFDEVLQMLVAEGIIRSDQIQDVRDYLLFKITITETDDTNEIALVIEGDFVFTELYYAWPLPAGYTRITSPFGMRFHPLTGTYSGHMGVDISAGIGTSVYAIDSGEVIFAGETKNGGKSVYIKHKGGVVSKYMHLNSILVREGQNVNRKDLIAYSGNTGRSTGPHLHFQIELNGKPVNPLSYY